MSRTLRASPISLANTIDADDIARPAGGATESYPDTISEPNTVYASDGAVLASHNKTVVRVGPDRLMAVAGSLVVGGISNPARDRVTPRPR